jgi:nucleoside-diphosphate-sugar epimerase
VAWASLAVLAFAEEGADAEQSAQRFTSGGGAGVVLRFAGFYGPDSPQTRQLISFVRHSWAPIPGAPERFFSSVTHDDAATAVVAALGLPAGVYNVADDEPLRRRELFDSLAATLGVAPPRFPPTWMTPLIGSLGATLARSERIANRKLRAASGWRPHYPSAREGWPDTVKAMRAST